MNHVLNTSQTLKLQLRFFSVLFYWWNLQLGGGGSSTVEARQVEVSHAGT